MKRNRLLIAGPVHVDEAVLEALAEQVLAHYESSFVEIYVATQALLRRLFETQNDVFLIPGPGTAGLEACMSTLLRSGDKVIIPSNGFFADRMAMLARAAGLVPVQVHFPWGEPIDPAVLTQQLRLHHDARAVVAVHHETSTGLLNPLAEIAAAAHDSGLPIIVDAVSSAGGVPLPLDKWGIDLCVTVPNKCLEAPPGLAIVAVGPRAWEQIEQVGPTQRGWYLDLRVWRAAARRSTHPTPVTMPSNVLVALHACLERLFAEGVEAHYSRIASAAESVREGLKRLGFRPLVQGRCACPVVTAVVSRPDVPVADLSAYLEKEHGLLVSGGMGPLADKVFRVGHMGKGTTPEYIRALLEGVEAYLRLRGLARSPSSSRSA